METTANTPDFGVSVAQPAIDEMASFYTREKHNDGIKVDLLLPNGGASGHWLILLGSRSDAMADARETMNREVVQKDAVRGIAVRRYLSKAVKNWSFSKPCTSENVCAFLLEAPQIQQQIDSVIFNDENFIKG